MRLMEIASESWLALLEERGFLLLHIRTLFICIVLVKKIPLQFSVNPGNDASLLATTIQFTISS